MYRGLPEPPICCSPTSSELKRFQLFIFCALVFLTTLLLLVYLFYLYRRTRWASIGMPPPLHGIDDLSGAESGLKKEHRELLPIIVFKESFSIKEIQCSVCLGEYRAEDRLQQMPRCGHTFHMGCIDRWLSTHTTCPLCRLSLLASSTAAPPDIINLGVHDSRPTDPENRTAGSNEASPVCASHQHVRSQALGMEESSKVSPGEGRSAPTQF